MRTLHLTSPLTRGDDVKYAQRLLLANVFGQAFLAGRPDGVFGELTAQACKRAKFWLGYPPEAQRGTFGDGLRGYLEGTDLPDEFLKARKKRVEAADGKPVRVKALAEAVKHIGETERPAGSNETEFGKWYGADRQAWCAMFVTWCYVKAGSAAFERGHRYAYVPYIVHDARAGVNHLAVTHEPQPGDLVCYDWQGDGIADHVGLFEKWIVKGATFQAVEGNTSRDDSGSQSNGGGVFRRGEAPGRGDTRRVPQVQAFVHVGA